MALAPGTRLGLFEVSALIGEGGMGQVYRARDTRLGRDVAIKVLPEAVEKDPERVARFEREAKALAALNHPNIATLLGLELSGTSHLLIMELVEGETLAEVVRRGPLAPPAAIAIARQIAEALESAHEHGIVHRDLKPANVKVTPNDTVKVLDFGLAKALDTTPGSSPHISESPTLSVMATAAGVILGTAAYMSPEQAKGLPADHRSDIFAFGGLLYELLTGRLAFSGDTVHDTLASVIAREPDWSALPAAMHPRLTQLLQRCLAKSRRQRWQAIGDVRAELEMIAADPTGGVTAQTAALAAPASFWRRAMPVAAGAAGATVLLGVAAWSMRPAPLPLPVTRFELAAPSVGTLNGMVLAISPDGSAVVLIGERQLWLRSLSAFEMRPIPGTEGRSFQAAFSPDGQSLAFVQASGIKTVALAGSAAVRIGEVEHLDGLSWDESGILVGAGTKGVVRIAQAGGTQEQLISMAPGEFAATPIMLPGEDVVLFALGTGGTLADWRQAQLVAQRPGSAERRILGNGSDPRYLDTGHLTFVTDGVLMAGLFDVKTLTFSSPPVPVIEGVSRVGEGGLLKPGAMAAVSRTGTLAYVPGPATTKTSAGVVLLTDRSGRDQQLSLPEAPYEAPRVSPDGKELALSTNDSREAVVLIYELSGTSAPRRFTFSGRNRLPIWSPDGRSIAFQSDREGDTAIFVQRADGSGTAERLTKPEPATTHIPESWSSDGRYLSFSLVSAKSTDLWLYDFRDKQARPFGEVSGVGPANSQFSPDGRWIAYTRRSGVGVASVFVQPVPATGAKYQVSPMNDTSHHPFWSRDGKALFYFGIAGNWLVSAPIRLGAGVTVGLPVRAEGSHPSNTTAQNASNYDTTLDGLRFVRTGNVSALADREFLKINVVLNWFEELKATSRQPP